ncbi:MAG: MFS transporter [Pseudomonadota bacterium]
MAGVLVDRWDRRWTMVISNLLQGVLVVLIPLVPGMWPIFVIYAAMSVVSQVFVPARSATIPALVPPIALQAANSLFAMGFVAAMAIGPALGTWLVSTCGVDVAFYVDALTFLVPALAVGLLVLPDDRAPRPAGSTFAGQLREGIAFALSHGEVRVALASAAAAFLIIGTLSVAGVVVATEVLHRESSAFGAMMSAAGLGMVAGGVAAGRPRGAPGHGHRPGRAPLVPVAGGRAGAGREHDAAGLRGGGLGPGPARRAPGPRGGRAPGGGGSPRDRRDDTPSTFTNRGALTCASSAISQLCPPPTSRRPAARPSTSAS